MKKLLSLLLCAMLALSCAAPAFATAGGSNFRSPMPIIMISGDGDAIVDKDGNKAVRVQDIPSFLGQSVEDGDNSALEAVQNVLMPMLFEGVLLDKWDNYYDALYKEISDLFKDIMLDENGEVSNGTDISSYHREVNEDRMHGKDRKVNGTYAFEDYHFWYDWRLDPLQIADELNEYIEAIKAKTGYRKVCVVTRCLGSSVLLAYMAKHGTDSLYGIGFDGTSSNGSEPISGALSGKFDIDGNSVSRFLDDSNAYELFSVDPFVASTLELLENSGALNGMTTAAKNLIYLKIEKGVVSAIARSTLFTMPCYWTLVKEEDFEDAKRYVFGEEGDEKRTTYAGLIEKIDNYDVTVRDRIPELLEGAKEAGLNVAVVSKYGSQIVPIVKDGDLVADQYASVASSSFGATTSKIGETLPEEYIAERVDEGSGRYISPDKQIDASTCLFPDSTWFLKGITHSDWTMVENDIFCQVLPADRQLTVNDLPYSQFIVGIDDYNWEVMTVDNCNTEKWSENATEKPTTKAGRLTLFIRSLISWLKLFFEKITALMKK